jgi:DUF1680 family protein
MVHLLSRRDATNAILGGAFAAAMAPRGEAAVAGADVLGSFDYAGVRLLDGMLHGQAQYAREIFLGIPDDSFLHGFRARAGRPAPGQSLAGWYGNDVWHPFGQYISGMARLPRALGDAEIGNKARRLVNEWAQTIGPKGYFFYSLPTKTPHYNYDKTMCGLVDVYKYLELKPAAEMMSRITDWATANLDRSRPQPTRQGANAGEWYTLSENLYRAFEVTGNVKFRTFGDVWRYPEYWNMFVSGKPPTPYGRHAYSHVNTLSGCAMAYRLTREPGFFKAIVNAFRWLEQTQMYATGGFGPSETLVPPDGALGQALGPDAASFETACGSWAGFKLGRYLLELTGESHYGDWIERLVYNGIGAALPLQPDGSTFYYSDYRVGGGRKVYFPEKWPCCSGTYIQAIADYQNLIYFHQPNALLVNLYVPSTVSWTHAGNEVELTQETAYPKSDTTSITVRTRAPETFALKLRIPRWCSGADAMVNGASAGISAAPGTWATIDRRWSNGDRVTLTLPMQPVLRPIDPQHPGRLAFSYGPVVLVGRGSGQTVRRNGRLAQSFERKSADLEFDLESITFVPFYRLGRGEPYQMYFDVAG